MAACGSRPRWIGAARSDSRCLPAIQTPSGGPLTANPMMATGLSRIAEAARAIQRGDGKRAVAHATSGQPLQQNLVCVLEGDK